jgi:4-hydroxy-tetrahydrodipicolinate reductase
MRWLLSGFGTMNQVVASLLEDAYVSVDPNKDQGYQSFGEVKEEVDVIIDFSHPSMLKDVLDFAVSKQVPLVIATTNIDDEGQTLIQEASKQIPILYTKNTSLGVNVLRDVVRQLASVLGDFDIEIVESHHNKKIDAPSGTAKLFVDEIKQSRDINVLYGRHGESKRQSNDVTVHAVRGGTIMGEHRIIFAGNDEVIELKHTALSKSLFAEGAIVAGRFLVKQEAGLYDMKDCLKGE